MRIKLEDLPEAARMRVEREIGAGRGRKKEKAMYSNVKEGARSRLDSLNKTERRFYDEYLSESLEGRTVIVQPPRFFELTGGGTYTPDFLVFYTGGYLLAGELCVYEVKGGYRGVGAEHGIERYRRAAAQYDCRKLRFCLVEWVRSKKRWGLTWWR